MIHISLIQCVSYGVVICLQLHRDAQNIEYSNTWQVPEAFPYQGYQQDMFGG